MTHADRVELRKEIAAAVAAGKSISEACVEFSVSSPTAYGACRENGVKPARHPKAMKGIPKAVRIIAALFKGDENQAKIAENLRVSRQFVSQVAIAARSVGLPVNAAEDSPETIRIIDVKLEGGIS